MSPQRESSGSANAANSRPNPVTESNSIATGKKPFVEPQISLPVDVLEATAFFQATTISASSLTP